MLFPNGSPVLDDFGRANGAIGSRWVASDFTGVLVVSGGKAATGQADGVDCGSAFATGFSPLEAVYARVDALPINLGVCGLRVSPDPLENNAPGSYGVDLVSTGGGAWALRGSPSGTQTATTFNAGDWIGYTVNQATAAASLWRLPSGGAWTVVASDVAAGVPMNGWYAILFGRDSQVRFGAFGAQTRPGADPTLNLPLVHGRGAC